MGDIVEAPIEVEPIKLKKPRSEKQIEAFAKAVLKKKELSEINKQFNDAKKQQKEDVVEHKKRIIKSVKEVEPVEVELEVAEPKLIKKKKSFLSQACQSALSKEYSMPQPQTIWRIRLS